MPERTFVANAYIHGGRWQHHRLRDHFGGDSDLYVVLAEGVGSWPEGTPIHFVIADLIARLDALESSNRIVLSFTANAYVINPGTWVEEPAGTWRSVSFVDAALRKTQTGSTTFRAWITGGGTFTANAVIRFEGSFSAYAVVV